jgi:DNA-binding NarL/FixJ family response regulator
MSLGASAYVLKTARSEDIVESVRSAIAGRPTIQRDFDREFARSQGLGQLSEREVSALRLAAAGLGNREIGHALNVSLETVKTRFKNILSKLGAQDRTHAVAIAARRGFIEP